MEEAIPMFRLFFQKTFMSNLITLMIFSIIITYLSNITPTGIYSRTNWLFRERKWEKNGEVYQQWVKVRHWKKFLPELGDFVKSVFPKKQIKDFSKDYLELYLMECCKSEMTHWCIILSSLLFSLWNELPDAIVIFVIAIILNMPYIIIQRYNRPRIIEAVESIDSHRRKVTV